MNPESEGEGGTVYRKARAADETFWQKQERQLQGATGQPCCTLSGISTGLINLPGNFAVIVHGESECAACFYHFGPSAHQFFCTALEEKHFVTGETSQPLVECLRMVAEEVDPEAIFILGACPIEVIGDRFERVVDGIQAEYPDIPMIPLHTSGLKVGSQAAMLDWMFSTLASLPAVEPVDQRWMDEVGNVGMALLHGWANKNRDQLDSAQQVAASLPTRPAISQEMSFNVLGLPQTPMSANDQEWRKVVEQLGLRVVGNFPYTASLDSWRAITYAPVTFILDKHNVVTPVFGGVLYAYA